MSTVKSSAVRVIACLDIAEGRVVIGRQFKIWADVDEPRALVEYYKETGADELIFYDISASGEGRMACLTSIAKAVAGTDIPFCIGGGISTPLAAEKCLAIGAKKVSVNSAAIENPFLLAAIAREVGKEHLVLAIDVKKNKGGKWNVYRRGGREDTGLDAIEWAKASASLGVGEIVVNSIDCDGMQEGYDIELLKNMKEAVEVPIVASGGAGRCRDFYEVIELAGIDGILAASVFHCGRIKICDLKNYLAGEGIPVLPRGQYYG